jgi:hypothetical protein
VSRRIDGVCADSREAERDFGETVFVCYGCDQRVTGTPRYDADVHAYCAECAPTYATDVDTVERWIAAGAEHHKAVDAEIEELARGAA